MAVPVVKTNGISTPPCAWQRRHLKTSRRHCCYLESGNVGLDCALIWRISPLPVGCQAVKRWWILLGLLSLIVTVSCADVSVTRNGFIAGPQYALVGENVYFICYPPFSTQQIRSFKWVHNGVPIVHTAGGPLAQNRYHLFGSFLNKLHLSWAESRDSGKLVCHMNVYLYKDNKQSATEEIVTVEHNLRIISISSSSRSSRDPEIELMARPSALFEGEEAHFFCNTTQTHPVRWKHTSRTGQEELSLVALTDRALQKGGWLLIPSIHRSDSGDLRCEAASRNGKTTLSTSINIWPGIKPSHRPKIELEPGTLNLVIRHRRAETAYTSYCTVVIKARHHGKDLKKWKRFISCSQDVVNVPLSSITGNDLSDVRFEGKRLIIKVSFGNKFGVSGNSSLRRIMPKGPVKPDYLKLVADDNNQGLTIKPSYAPQTHSSDDRLNATGFTYEYKISSNASHPWKKIGPFRPSLMHANIPLRNLSRGSSYSVRLFVHTTAKLDYIVGPASTRLGKQLLGKL